MSWVTVFRTLTSGGILSVTWERISARMASSLSAATQKRLCQQLPVSRLQ